MTWIKVIPPSEADPNLRHCYEEVYALYPEEYHTSQPAAIVREDGGTDSIVAAHSLIPDALRHAMSTFAVLMAPNLPLTRRQHEMIATLVSALNRCFH